MQAYSKKYKKLVDLIRIKSGWTIKDNTGIINLRPYNTRTELVQFLNSCGYQCF